MTTYKAERMNKYINTTDWQLAMYGLIFVCLVSIGDIISVYYNYYQ